MGHGWGIEEASESAYTMLLDGAQRVKRTDVFVHRLAFHRHFPCLKKRLQRIIQEMILGFVDAIRLPGGPVGSDNSMGTPAVSMSFAFVATTGRREKVQILSAPKGSLFPTPIRGASLKKNLLL